MTNSRQLEIAIKNMGELPTLPSVFFTVSKMLSEPRTSASDVGQAVSSDQVIASKILKIANSAFYGLTGRVNTVSHAIAVLGFSATKNIVLTTSVLSALNLKNPIKGFNLAAFWKHSAAVGAIAKLIAKEVLPSKQEEAFAAGLLHDIGKLVLAICAPEDFAKCINLAVGRKGLFLDAEKELLGVDHTDIAVWVNDKWKLPAEIAAALTNHHKDIAVSGKYGELVAVVKLADVLARGLQLGHACDSSIPIMEDKSWDLLKMTPQKLDKILIESHEAMQNSMVFVTD
ncbi:MAG: HDOD domain-containing protein [Fibromonadaceae bacterium]|nr:HDOD domain-containing protein [Fibromonadaceae bacterium]